MDKDFRGERAAVNDWACDQIARTAGRLEGSEGFPHVTDDGCWRTWPADLVPLWDFADDPSAPKDSSATAICVNAFLELGEVHPDALRRAYDYRSMAEAMLTSLWRDYLRRDQEKEEGTLLHCAYSVPHNDGVDSSVMRDEWFFLGAVSHLAADAIPIP